MLLLLLDLLQLGGLRFNWLSWDDLYHIFTCVIFPRTSWQVWKDQLSGFGQSWSLGLVLARKSSQLFSMSGKRIHFVKIFIYFWLHWVFVAVCGLSLVVASGGYSLLRCTGFSLRWLHLLRNTGSRHAGFSSVARGLSSCGSWALERRPSSCGTRA